MSWSNPRRSTHAWERSKPTNAWTIDDVRRLRELAEHGVDIGVIASELRRSVSSIRNKAGMHGISLHGGRASHARRVNEPGDAAVAGCGSQGAS